MRIEQINNLENDINLLIIDNFHPRHRDLMNIAIREDVLELIKFAKKVHELFNYELPPGSGDQYRGFKICHESLKKDLYG